MSGKNVSIMFVGDVMLGRLVGEQMGAQSAEAFWGTALPVMQSLEEAKRPACLKLGGLNLSILSLTDNEPAFAATATTPGTWYGDIGNSNQLDQELATTIRTLKQTVDLAVLSTHWGPNMVLTPPHHSQSFARSMIETGVDVYHGHSAHVFQGVQSYNHKLILYDTGECVDDYAVDPELRNDWSFLFVLDADKDGPMSLTMLPVFLNVARVDLATGKDFTNICQRMLGLSAMLGTPLKQTEKGLELLLR